MCKSVAAPSYAEVVKPRAQKASSRSKYVSKERREKRQKARQDERDETVKEAEEEDEDEYEEEDQEDSSDEDVWATEDDEYYDNESDNSQEEYYGSPLVSVSPTYLQHTYSLYRWRFFSVRASERAAKPQVDWGGRFLISPALIRSRLRRPLARTEKNRQLRKQAYLQLYLMMQAKKKAASGRLPCMNMFEIGAICTVEITSLISTAVLNMQILSRSSLTSTFP